MNEFSRIDNLHTPELNNQLFTMYRGWDQTLVADLVEGSNEPQILTNTPNDAARRFRNTQAANLWHDEGQRTVYSLYGKSLAGVIWYDVRSRPEIDAEYTFAIRMYEEARGRKLAHAFMKAAHLDFAEHQGDPTVWLDVSLDNGAALYLYDKFGYEATHQEDDRQVMVYRPNVQ